MIATEEKKEQRITKLDERRERAMMASLSLIVAASVLFCTAAVNTNAVDAFGIYYPSRAHPFLDLAGVLCIVAFLGSLLIDLVIFTPKNKQERKDSKVRLNLIHHALSIAGISAVLVLCKIAYFQLLALLIFVETCTVITLIYRNSWVSAYTYLAKLLFFGAYLFCGYATALILSKSSDFGLAERLSYFALCIPIVIGLTVFHIHCFIRLLKTEFSSHSIPALKCE